MGIGSMMAGGNPVAGRQYMDFYPTPTDVTKSLLNVWEPAHTVWEPMAGNGAMVDVLKKEGHSVISGDVRTGQDFFSYTQPLAECMITNPPFNRAPEVIEHAFRIGIKHMALVLKSTFWHASRRHKLYLKHRPSLVLPMLWRPDFLNKGAPTMECMWCVWDSPCAEETIYQPLTRGKTQ